MSNTPLDRKHEILDSLHTHLSARTRRKRAIRAAASSAGVLALAAAVYFSLPAAPTLQPVPSGTNITQADPPANIPETSPDTAPVPSNSTAVAAAPSHVTVRIARSDPIPTTPCESAAATTVCILSDDQLLAALAEAGQPSGLVRTGGETFVVPIGSSQPLR
jgi:hypothetical protein